MKRETVGEWVNEKAHREGRKRQVADAPGACQMSMQIALKNMRIQKVNQQKIWKTTFECQKHKQKSVENIHNSPFFSVCFSFVFMILVLFLLCHEILVRKTWKWTTIFKTVQIFMWFYPLLFLSFACYSLDPFIVHLCRKLFFIRQTCGEVKGKRMRERERVGCKTTMATCG